MIFSQFYRLALNVAFCLGQGVSRNLLQHKQVCLQADTHQELIREIRQMRLELQESSLLVAHHVREVSKELQR